MPLNQYFKKPGKKTGKGNQVMKKMQAKYGKKKGTSVFYATVNRMRKGSKKQKAVQPKQSPGTKKGGKK